MREAAVSSWTPRGRESSAPPTWQELSKEQQCVLFGAEESSMLLGVLADWEPGLDWPGRARHIARLAQAAQSLVEMGLIEVIEQPLGPGETSVLTKDAAIAELRDRRNWWAGDLPTDTGAPDIYANRILELAITGDALQVLSSRQVDDLYAFRSHDDP